MSPDGHLGTKAKAAASLFGEAWLGAVLAGAMVSQPLLIEMLLTQER